MSNISFLMLVPRRSSVPLTVVQQSQFINEGVPRKTPADPGATAGR